MQRVRVQVLEANLNNARFGTPVRAFLNLKTYQKIVSLKMKSGRTYRDIFSVLLNLYNHHRGRFPIKTPELGRRRTLNLRLSREDALLATDWAWERRERRCYFLGFLAKHFFKMVPLKAAVKVFKEQRDRAMLFKEALWRTPKKTRSI